MLFIPFVQFFYALLFFNVRIVQVFHELYGPFIKKWRMIDLSLEWFLKAFEKVFVLLVFGIDSVIDLLPALATDFFGSFSPDKLKVLLLAFTKERVFEDKALILLFDFVEIIHVELPDKGGEIGVSEVLG